MTRPARQLLSRALKLSESERLQLASELIASIDGPPDADWDEAWLTELDRRIKSAQSRPGAGQEWSEVRARILKSEVLVAAFAHAKRRPGYWLDRRHKS